jgi:hypothetical protein
MAALADGDTGRISGDEMSTAGTMRAAETVIANYYDPQWHRSVTRFC